MERVVQVIVDGWATGSLYGALALAVVLIYRSTGILNFAQGEMALFSTYMTWQFTDWGIGVVGAIALSMAFAFVAGAVIERVLIRPVEGAHNPLNVVIVTLGMFLAINALALIIFGTTERKVPYVFPTDSWDVLGTNVAKETVGMAAVLVAECVLLWALLQKTKIGLRLRAVASNPDSSRLVGINTGAMLMLGWGLAAAIGALAGSLFAAGETAFAGSSMQIILVYAFAAAALGGFDSLVGAVVGGLIVGIANALTIEYVDFLEGIELALPLGLILAVLLVRPNGLFGTRRVERV